MDAAFDLGLAGPAAAARILARLHRLRAGEAADRQIAIGDQRVLAQRVRAHVVGLVRRRPAGQRVDADARADRLRTPAAPPRVAAWKRLRPVNQARNGATPRAIGSTLRISQQASVSVWCSLPSGSSALERGLVGLQHLHVGQAEIGDQRVAVVQRLLEMLAGVEEQHRQRAVDARRSCGAAPPNPRRRTTPPRCRRRTPRAIAQLDDLLGRQMRRRARRGSRPRPSASASPSRGLGFASIERLLERRRRRPGDRRRGIFRRVRADARDRCRRSSRSRR